MRLKNRKKAFTLIELMGVLVILGVLSMIVVPVINKTLKESKQNLYLKQLETVKASAKNFGSDNKFMLPEEENESFSITLAQLQNTGYIDRNIKDPRNDETLSTCLTVNITNKGNYYDYTIDEDSIETECVGSAVVEISNPSNKYIKENGTSEYIITVGGNAASTQSYKISNLSGIIMSDKNNTDSSINTVLQGQINNSYVYKTTVTGGSGNGNVNIIVPRSILVGADDNSSLTESDEDVFEDFESNSIGVDNQCPEITVSPVDSTSFGTTQKSQSINVSAEDPDINEVTSGIDDDSLKYIIGSSSSNPTKAFKNNSQIASDEPLTSTEENKIYAVIKACDKLGNCTTKNDIELKLDNTAPACPTFAVNEYYQHNDNSYFIYTDVEHNNFGISGISADTNELDFYQYSTDKIPTKIYNRDQIDNGIDDIKYSESKRDIRAKVVVRDSAGNENTCESQKFSASYDTPTISISATDSTESKISVYNSDSSELISMGEKDKAKTSATITLTATGTLFNQNPEILYWLDFGNDGNNEVVGATYTGPINVTSNTRIKYRTKVNSKDPTQMMSETYEGIINFEIIENAQCPKVLVSEVALDGYVNASELSYFKFRVNNNAGVNWRINDNNGSEVGSGSEIQKDVQVNKDDGKYTFTITASETGKFDSTCNIGTYTIDREEPSCNNLNVLTDGIKTTDINNKQWNSNAVKLMFYFNSPNDIVKWDWYTNNNHFVDYVDSYTKVGSDYVGGREVSFQDATGNNQGMWTGKVVLYDKAGNTSTCDEKIGKYYIDRVAPTCPKVTSSPSKFPTNASAVNFEFTFDTYGGSMIGTKSWDWYTDSDGVNYTNWSTNNSIASNTRGISGEGNRKLKLVVRDQSGLERTCIYGPYKIDRTAYTPNVDWVSGATDPFNQNSYMTCNNNNNNFKGNRYCVAVIYTAQTNDTYKQSSITGLENTIYKKSTYAGGACTNGSFQQITYTSKSLEGNCVNKNHDFLTKSTTSNYIHKCYKYVDSTGNMSSPLSVRYYFFDKSYDPNDSNYTKEEQKIIKYANGELKNQTSASTFCNK